jgi:hypothetical protein
MLAKGPCCASGGEIFRGSFIDEKSRVSSVAADMFPFATCRMISTRPVQTMGGLFRPFEWTLTSNRASHAGYREKPKDCRDCIVNGRFSSGARSIARALSVMSL